MPTCYLHQQHYQMDEYCIYCGNPFVEKTATSGTAVCDEGVSRQTIKEP